MGLMDILKKKKKRKKEHSEIQNNFKNTENLGESQK